jgi:hypothetical protein
VESSKNQKGREKNKNKITELEQSPINLTKTSSKEYLKTFISLLSYHEA